MLPITDGDEDDNDGEDDGEEEEEQEVLSNRAYDTRLRNVFFPKNNFDSHDEYCDEIQLTINQSLAVGLKDKDIAIILRSHIQKTNLRSAFQTELRGKLNPTTKQIMRALRNCEKENLNMTNEEKFNLLRPRDQESWFNFIKRVEKYFDDHKVAAASFKTRMIKELLVKVVHNLPKHVANIITSPTLALADLAQYVQDEMRRANQPKHQSNVSNAAQQNNKNGHRFNQSRSDQNYNQPHMNNTIASVDQEPMQAHQEHFPVVNEPPHQHQNPVNLHHPDGQQNGPGGQQNTHGGQQNIPGSRAPPPLYQNLQRPLCGNCQRIGHRWQDCQWTAFCSRCLVEGHQNRSHYQNHNWPQQRPDARQWNNIQFQYGGTNQDDQQVPMNHIDGPNHGQ